MDIKYAVYFRLPIVQGATFSLVIPALSILALPKWRCPSKLTLHLLVFTCRLPVVIENLEKQGLLMQILYTIELDVQI